MTSRSRRARVTVVGDGGWGTTLAIHLSHLGHQVAWWGAFPDYLKVLASKRENVKYLPGVPIPKTVRIVPDLCAAVTPSQILVLAVPSQHMRSVARKLCNIPLKGKVLVSVAKGIEQRSLKRMSEVLKDELPGARLAVLSGPNIAFEIAAGQPASAVVASDRSADAITVQRMLLSERFRVYTSADVAGVELGGALKNPIAIAAGISDGLGFGSNAKAALITRGIAEMARLGTALGAKPATFWGLSGLGDLITTCISGRNHWLGEQLGKGHTLKQVLGSTPMVIEGVDTCRAALALARLRGIELPIMQQVHAILFQGRTPKTALQRLMRRLAATES